MRLHLVVDVTPEDGKRPAKSEVLLEVLEAELEDRALDVEGRVYEVKVLGSGRSAHEAAGSMLLRGRR